MRQLKFLNLKQIPLLNKNNNNKKFSCNAQLVF